MTELFRGQLLELGVSTALAFRLAQAGTVLLVVLLAWIANRVARRYLLRAIATLAQKTETGWDDILVRRRVFDRLAHLAPLMVFRAAAGSGLPLSENLIREVTGAAFYIIAVLVFFALLDAIVEIYEGYGVSRKAPIAGYLQGLKTLAVFLAAVFVIAALMQADPWTFLKGLGALAAVLLLIFKDTILGFVASVQITANDMIRIGDWIEMKEYGADGDVVEVGLTSVKVRNWDKTIATIPTYAMVSAAFRNWRGMEESGGRRIKRAIYLDMNCIKFCSKEMIERFAQFEHLRDYLDQRLPEVERHNRERDVDMEQLVNGRRLTNVGTFRAYLQAYLRAHPRIHRELTFLVRQLAPTANGLPIEIYVFSSDQNWANYEGIQADIMDHVLAVLPEFELRVYQAPSGADLAQLSLPATK